MPETPRIDELTARLLEARGGVYFFPIRYHSPACVRHLERAFNELKPATVLIEMPSDFQPLLELVVDTLTRPPVAIVSLPGDKQAGAPSYWPFSASSPEYTAIQLAHNSGARIICCDLPSGARDMRNESDEPVILTSEQAFDHSTYVQSLTQQMGCRDWNEAWDRLFERRIAEPDWRRFFVDIAAYCALTRATAPPEQLERDGTLARESAMRFHLDAAIGDKNGPIFVITGGFHTAPLLMGTAKPAKPPHAAARSFLVHYSHDWLDHMNGYAAGMPSPRYYEMLHEAANQPDPFEAVAQRIFQDLAQRLRKDRPAAAPRLPALIAALKQARLLADLRDQPGPGRWEIIDAARSCFVKDEDPRHAAPVLEELAADLTGRAMGDVPPGAGSPPIVEAARRTARAFRFDISDSVRRKRELDIHRDENHAKASRFLYAMQLLGTGFGRLEQGLDYVAGVDLDVLFEIWSYGWSPLVEATLIEGFAGCDTLEAACLQEIRRRAKAFEEEGKGNSSAAAAQLVFVAAQAGLDRGVEDLFPLLSELIQRDADLVRVATALRTLYILWRARRALGFTGSTRLLSVLRYCYRRAIDLMRLLPAASAERAHELVTALSEIKEVIDGGEEIAFDRDLFDQTVAGLLDEDLPPMLVGALSAVAALSGMIEPARFSSAIGGAISGAQLDPAQCVAPLAGALAIAPELIRRLDSLRLAIDVNLGRLEEERFIELLPHLRMALTALNPADTRSLAQSIAAHHRADQMDLTASL